MKGEGRLWFFCEQKKQQKKRNSQAVQKIEKVSKNKEFFFEKKNQKTFAPLCEVVARPLAKNYQSFFASFCSQKEVLSFLLLFKIIFSFVRLGSYKKTLLVCCDQDGGTHARRGANVFWPRFFFKKSVLSS